MTEIIALESVAQRILVLRGQKVMLDSDLAELFGVQTKVFNQAVMRNLARFPADFMFQLDENEHESLRSQIVTLKNGRGRHRKYPPYAFTEHGAIMAATILNSPQAVEMSVFILKTAVERRKPFDTPAAQATQGERSLTKLVTTPFVLSSAVSCAYRSMSEVATAVFRFIVRAFVQLREILSTHKELAAKLLELERKVTSHDQAIVGLMNGIRELMKHPIGESRPIGFTAKIKGSKA